MTTKVKHSVIPIYLIGVIWLVFGLFFSLHTAFDYIVCVLISVIGFVLGRAIFPDKLYQVTEEAKTPPPAQEDRNCEAQTPDVSPEIAALLKERDRALSEMRRLNESIADAAISAQIDHLEDVTKRILDYVVSRPEKLPQIRRFLDYYLPTTLKILNAYDRMDSAGISGENIDTTKQKVETMISTISSAFDRQLDALFGDEALDISTDIKVMENMLAQEGLGGLQL